MSIWWYPLMFLLCNMVQFSENVIWWVGLSSVTPTQSAVHKHHRQSSSCTKHHQDGLYSLPQTYTAVLWPPERGIDKLIYNFLFLLDHSQMIRFRMRISIIVSIINKYTLTKWFVIMKSNPQLGIPANCTFAHLKTRAKVALSSRALASQESLLSRLLPSQTFQMKSCLQILILDTSYMKIIHIEHFKM